MAKGGMCGKGGHAWQRGMHHEGGHVQQRGVCVVKGHVCGEGACMVRGPCVVGGCAWQGMHGRGYAW